MLFVGTRADLEPGVRAIEEELALQYIARGFHSSPQLEVFHSALEIPRFGQLIRLNYQYGERRVSPADYMSAQQYYVCTADREFEARRVPLKEGGVLYYVDTESNPFAFVFYPGGLDQRDELYAGYCAIGPTQPPETMEFARSYFARLTKGFRTALGLKVTGGKERYRVGPEAMEMLKSGVHLLTVQALPIFLPEK